MNKKKSIHCFYVWVFLCAIFFPMDRSATFAATAMRPFGGGAVLRMVESPTLKLESIIVEVNGERRRVAPPERLVIVRGDIITIIDSYLVDKSKRVPLVDIVGYFPAGHKTTKDRRGVVIDTNRDFDPRYSQDGLGNSYSIQASGSGVMYGEVLLTMLNPQLISCELEINGIQRQLKTQETLTLKKSDQIKILDIKTNVRGNENVKYDLLTYKSKQGQMKKELRFSRGETVFAKIPIEWTSP